MTDRQVAALKEPGRHSIGGNLILIVGANGNRSWIARVTDVYGRRRDIGLGTYPDVSLKEAREEVTKSKLTIRKGDDPVAVKTKTAVPTFEQAARQVHDGRKATYRNAKHSQQWLKTLERYAFPKIGKLPVSEVRDSEVIRLLEPIWTEKSETARRVLQRINAVTAWSFARGYREHDLSANGIRAALPPQLKKSTHFAAVAVGDAPEVWRKLNAKADSTARNALKFTILTCVRSGEARGARWEEVDLANKSWTVPAERTKTATEHAVALSNEACSLLESVPSIKNEQGLIFPNVKGKALSDVAVSKALKEIAPRFTVHGWRSTFRDWAAEQTTTPREIVETALAHSNPNKVEAAYRRTNFLEKRRPLMEEWAKFLTACKNLV